MNSLQEKLLAILNIGHDTSIRGKGVSLRQALCQVNYLEARRQFTSQDLLRLIQERRQLIGQWILYSANIGIEP